jgi:hypothetical protein
MALSNSFASLPVFSNYVNNGINLAGTAVAGIQLAVTL